MAEQQEVGDSQVRCRACDSQYPSRSINDHTGEMDNLCKTCRDAAFDAADSENYKELVPGNYYWPAKRIMPDE